MNNSLENRRKRRVLSIEDKIQIVEKLENGSTIQQIMVQYDIGHTTVRNIRDKKDEYLTYVATSDAPDVFKRRKTMKTSTFAHLDSCLIEWFHQERYLGTPINGLLVAAQAKYFFEELGLEGNFNASNGWLTRFKNRYGIREISVQGEKLSANENAASTFVREFSEFIETKNLTLEQIYNADETGLYWRCLPCKTLAAQRETSAPGVKPSKERITVLCCANASGTHRLNLSVIGKSKKPQCFKNTQPEDIPADYYNQTSAWMDRDIFSRWFFDKFVPQVRERLRQQNLTQTAVLLLDNAPSHPAENLLKTEDGKIFVKYMPPNVTSLVQPMDQGPIAALKKIYRGNLLKTYVQEKSTFKTFKKDFNILDAITLVSTSWANIKSETLQRCWRKLLSPDVNLEVTPAITVQENREANFNFLTMTVHEDIDPSTMAEKFRSADGGENVCENDVMLWIDSDKEAPVFEQLSVSQIVEKVTNPIVPQQVEVSTFTKNKISPSDALMHLEKVLDFFEGDDKTTYTDIIFLKKMRSNLRYRESKSNENKKQQTLNNFFSVQ